MELLYSSQLFLIDKAFTKHKALLIEPFQFFHITCYSSHLHGSFWTYDHDLSPILHTFDKFQLAIVFRNTTTQCHSLG